MMNKRFSLPVLGFCLALAWGVLVYAQSRSDARVSPELSPEAAAAEVFEIADDRAKRFGVVGAQFGMIGPQGHIPHSFGTAAPGQNVTPSTPFNIGSVSKPVTAWGIVSLARSGAISLDDPISSHLEQFTLPPSKYDHDQVTIRRLLQHRGGTNIMGYAGYPDPLTPARMFREASQMPETLADSARSDYPVAVVREPGANRVYSGGGYSLLQMAMEDVTNRPFPEAMDGLVLKPLGMDDASFDPARLEDEPVSYSYAGKSLKEMRFLALAAAGLYASGDDMAAFIGAHFKPENRDIANTLFAAQPGRGTYATAYTRDEGNGRTLYGHGGNNSSWHAQLYLVPETAQGFYFLTNTTVGAQLEMDVSCAWKSWAMAGVPDAQCADMMRLARQLSLAAGVIGILAIALGTWLVWRVRRGHALLSAWPRGANGWGTAGRFVALILLATVLLLVLVLRFHDFFFWRRNVTMIDEIPLHELHLLVPAVIAMLVVLLGALFVRRTPA